MSRRQDIRSFLLTFFDALEGETSVEDCLNAYIESRALSASYVLKKGEIKTSSSSSSKERLRLRSQISQELNVMRQMGLIGRARYGRYVKRGVSAR